MSLFKKEKKSTIPTSRISTYVENLLQSYSSQRRSFERRWYDNNFFDDGFHFRYLSRKTGRIVDVSQQSNLRSPQRAIPKASRQIRGVASLLLQLEPTPAIYPERVQTPQMIEGQENPAYLQAKQKAKEIALKVGYYVEDEWDEQEIRDKLIHMMLLTAKHGISYLQVWADAVSEKIESKVFDAFEIFLDGTLTEIYDSPSITKATPILISKIKANELFDEDQRVKISPDNRYASSEVKQAYMQSRFGNLHDKEKSETLILKETFIKEYLSEENASQFKELSKGKIEGKKIGDMIMRHVFSTTNGWLLDEYVDMDEYPFVDLRFEPGLIYQVPLIERFIPQNKSLDIAVSRVEGYTNTMISGIYMVRKGENYQISNMPGGQKIEYDTTKPEQMQMAPIPTFVFNFISLLESFIEEQGASTTTLGNLPPGVKSGKAIESLKATEYANLKIPSDSYKKTVKRIAMSLISIAADTLVQPKEVATIDGDEVDYFDVIGEKGVEAREKVGLTTPEEWVIVKKKSKVRIEVETGLGYTMEGKKETMQQVANYMLELANAGMVGKEQVQIVLKKFLEIFQFGSTGEFMEAMEQGQEMGEEQIDQMKVAIMEVLKDTGMAGEKAEEKQIETTKMGVVEALKDTGMLNKPEESKPPSRSISFKDLPPSGKEQLAAQAGIQISPASAVEEPSE